MHAFSSKHSTRSSIKHILTIILFSLPLISSLNPAYASLSPDKLIQAKQAYAQARQLAQTPIKSVVILPVIDQTTSHFGALAVQTALQRNLLQLGYYVIPPVISNRFFKDNGVAYGEDIANIPASKITNALGADAVVYTELQHFGHEYTLLIQNITYKLNIKMVDKHNQLQFARENVGFTIPQINAQSWLEFAVETLSNVLQEATTSTAEEREFSYRLAMLNRLDNPNFDWDYEIGGASFGPYSRLYHQDYALTPEFYGLSAEDIADIQTKLRLPK